MFFSVTKILVCLNVRSCLLKHIFSQLYYCILYIYIVTICFQGFEHIDPFIPVMVPELSTVEFNNMLDYYEEKRWLQKSGGRKELEFLTSKLPADLMARCAPL